MYAQALLLAGGLPIRILTAKRFFLTKLCAQQSFALQFCQSSLPSCPATTLRQSLTGSEQLRHHCCAACRTCSSVEITSEADLATSYAGQRKRHQHYTSYELEKRLVRLHCSCFCNDHPLSKADPTQPCFTPLPSQLLCLSSPLLSLEQRLPLQQAR